MTKQSPLARMMALVKKMESGLFANALKDGKAILAKKGKTPVKTLLAKMEQLAKYPIHLKLSVFALLV